MDTTLVSYFRLLGKRQGQNCIYRDSIQIASRDVSMCVSFWLCSQDGWHRRRWVLLLLQRRRLLEGGSPHGGRHAGWIRQHLQHRHKWIQSFSEEVSGRKKLFFCKLFQLPWCFNKWLNSPFNKNPSCVRTASPSGGGGVPILLVVTVNQP